MREDVAILEEGAERDEDIKVIETMELKMGAIFEEVEGVEGVS